MDRLAERLKALGFEGQISPLAQDVSTRKYYRLHGGKTYVVMEDLSEGARVAQDKFVNIANCLRENGAYAPEIFAKSDGLLVLEDFGDESLFARMNSETASAGVWLEAALRVWRDLQDVPIADLPVYSREIYLEEISRFDRFYLARRGEKPSGLVEAFRPLIEDILAVAPRFTYVDFHAQNLMILSDKRFGLIDFQDARAGHPLYDAVSLIHDVRRTEDYDLRKNLEAKAIKYAGFDAKLGARHAAILSAQRNIKIIGIFARMVSEGRLHYTKYFPYLWQLVNEALAHEALAEIRDIFANYALPDDPMMKALESVHVE